MMRKSGLIAVCCGLSGDDCYYTEPITDHFFYYEAHY